jgi:hypothetical protein
MLVPESPLLSLRLRRPRRDGARWERLFPPEAVLFPRGRDALAEGLRLLVRSRRLERVWVPALLCRSVTEAVQAARLEFVLYDIDERLEPCWGTLAPRRGDALLVVHYFGLLQPMAHVHALCRERGLGLVEDCAQALPDPGARVPAGSWGDVAVFSLRKQVPVPAGGVLVARRPWLMTAEIHRPDGAAARVGPRLAMMVAERVAFALGVNVLRVKERLVGRSHGSPGRGGEAGEAGPGDTRMEGSRNGGGEGPRNGPGKTLRNEGVAGLRNEGGVGSGRAPAVAPLVGSIAHRIDWEALIRAKQENYTRLARRLQGVADVVVPMPSPVPGSVPLALPVWVDDPGAVARRLRRAGVEAIRWPGDEQVALPLDGFRGARAWLGRAVALPVTAGLTAAHLDRMAAALEEAVRGLPRGRGGARRVDTAPGVG